MTKSRRSRVAAWLFGPVAALRPGGARRRTTRRCRRSTSPRRARSCGAAAGRAAHDRAAGAAPAAPAEAPLQGTLPIVTDQFATVTVVPRRKSSAAPARRSGDRAVLQARHHRLELRARRRQPADRPRPRRQPRRHRRERHRRRRRVRPRRGPLRAGRSAGDRPDRGDPRAGDAALRLAVDRRRRQLDQQPHSRRAAVRAVQPASAAAGLDKARRDVDQRVRSVEMRGACRASTTAARAACCSMPATATSPSTPTPSAAAPTTTACRAIPISSRPIRPSCRSRPSPAASTAGSRTRAMRSDGESIGGSYLFTGGFAGVAFTQNNNLYGIPGADGEDHGTRIDAHQNKVTGKGEFRPSATGIDAIRFWWGYTDYKHNEIGFADAADPATDGVRQTFTNKELEGRVEVQLTPFNLRFAELTTAIGVQGGHQQLTAPGDDPAARSTACSIRTRTTRVAGYIFNEFKFSDTTKAQIAGRIEQVNLSGMTPAFIPDTFDRRRPQHRAGHPRNLSFTPKSASVGLIQNLPWDLVGSVTAQYVERAPKPAELFSRGAHDATGDLRHRQSQSQDRDREIGRGRPAAGQGPVPLRGHRLLHAVRRLHLPAADRQHLRRGRLRRSGHRDPGAQPGGLFAARRDLPRRRIPVPVGRAADVARLLRRRRPVRHRARDLHRRQQRAAHPAAAARRRRLFPQRRMARRASTCCTPSRRTTSPSSARRRPPATTCSRPRSATPGS